MSEKEGQDNKFMPDENVKNVEETIPDEREIAEDARRPVIDYPNIEETKETLQVSATEAVSEPDEQKLQQINEKVDELHSEFTQAMREGPGTEANIKEAKLAEPYKFYLEYSGHGDTFLVAGPFESKAEAQEAHRDLDMPEDWKRDYLWITKFDNYVPFGPEHVRDKLAAMRSAKSIEFEWPTKLSDALNYLMGLSFDTPTRAAEETVVHPPHIDTVEAGPEEPLHCRTIGEIWERCGDLAAVLQNELDPVLAPPSTQSTENAVGDYGAGAKNQAMRVYNLLEDIHERLEL